MNITEKLFKVVGGVLRYAEISLSIDINDKNEIVLSSESIAEDRKSVSDWSYRIDLKSYPFNAVEHGILLALNCLDKNYIVTVNYVRESTCDTQFSDMALVSYNATLKAVGREGEALSMSKELISSKVFNKFKNENAESGMDAQKDARPF